MVENGAQGSSNKASNGGGSTRVKRLEHELRKCLGKENHEVLLKSYSCAWQKDILVHGRLYITPNWFGFYSSILGWETKTSIKCQEVTSISKQKTVRVFPNAVLIEVGDKKFGFTSLVHRDKAYQVLCLVWQNSLLEKPLSVDELRIQLKEIKKGAEFFERSVSFTQESSDPESVDSSFHYPPSSSLSTLSRRVSQDSHTSGEEQEEHSSSQSMEAVIEDSIDGAIASSTDIEEEEELGSKASETNEEDSQSDTSSSVVTARSPSLVALASKAATRSSSVEEAPSHSEDSRRHNNPTVVGRGSTRANKTVALLWKLCNPTIIVNVIILLSIFFVVLSSVSMLCRLSHVEPALQPYLYWQPWCRLCVSVAQPETHSPFSYDFSSANSQDRSLPNSASSSSSSYSPHITTTTTAEQVT